MGSRDGYGGDASLSQLFYDLKKLTDQILFGKGKAEDSWPGPWALSTAGCFVCWAEI